MDYLNGLIDSVVKAGNGAIDAAISAVTDPLKKQVEKLKLYVALAVGLLLLLLLRR